MDETTAFIRGEEVLLDGSVRRYGGTNFSESVKEAHDSSKASIQSRISNLESGGVKGTGEVSNSSEKLSRIEYLRNKYGRFTPRKLNHRINLRGAVEKRG